MGRPKKNFYEGDEGLAIQNWMKDLDCHRKGERTRRMVLIRPIKKMTIGKKSCTRGETCRSTSGTVCSNFRHKKNCPPEDGGRIVLRAMRN